MKKTRRDLQAPKQKECRGKPLSDKASPVSPLAKSQRGPHSDEGGDLDVTHEIWQTALYGQRQNNNAESIHLGIRGSLSTEGDDAHPLLSDSLTHHSSMSEPTCMGEMARGSTASTSDLISNHLSMRGASRFDVQMYPVTSAQSAPFMSLTSFSLDQPMPDSLLPLDLPQIEDDWFPSEAQVLRGCHYFFLNVSHYVPFIHQPTFDASQLPPYLLLSMLCLGYQHCENPESGDQHGSGVSLSVRCFHRARVLMACDEESTDDAARNISMVQAYLLLQIHAMMYLCGTDSSYGLKTHSRMISLARAGGLMQPMPAETAATHDLDSLWREFVKAESHKRTLFAVHQIDALWYQFLSIPRSLSHLEVKHDLPCPVDYWTASTSVEWAHRQLVGRNPASSVPYPDAVRCFLSSEADVKTIPAFDPYGAINITQFLTSSAREISGWSTMTGRLSTERLEPLRSSLLALGPFVHSPPETANATHTALYEATWETAMIEVQMWSPSHTGGIVEGSMDAVLHQMTYLAPSRELLCEPSTAESIQPHVDWFLRYLDATLVPDSEAPWITLYAFKAFMIAWQLTLGGMAGSMRAVDVPDGDIEGCLAWARKAFGRRERWQLGKIVLACLDALAREAM